MASVTVRFRAPAPACILVRFAFGFKKDETMDSIDKSKQQKDSKGKKKEKEAPGGDHHGMGGGF